MEYHGKRTKPLGSNMRTFNDTYSSTNAVRRKTDNLNNKMRIVSNVYSQAGAILVPAGTMVDNDVRQLLSKHFIEEVMVDYPNDTLPSLESSRLRIPVRRLRVGMRIAQEVRSQSGFLIVREGAIVTSDIKKLLTLNSINMVVIEMPKEEEEDPLESKLRSINEEKYRQFKQDFMVAEDLLSDNLKAIVETDEQINVPALLNIVNQIISSVQSDHGLCNMLLHMKKETKGLYNHSINVAIMGELLAKWMEYDNETTEKIVMAGLLHDIGILKLPAEKQKSFRFREETRNSVYQKHVLNGYRAIQKKNIDQQVKQAVLTHHERMDGSGFPLGVMGNNINYVSRALAIVDMYDTLLMNEDGNAPVSPFSCIKWMTVYYQKYFDPQLLMVFSYRVAQVFLQHTVLLNNGVIGKIILINKHRLDQPLVQVGDQFIDLGIKTNLFVQEILD